MFTDIEAPLIAIEIMPIGDIVFRYMDGSTFNTGLEEGEDTWAEACRLAEQAGVEVRYPVSCEVTYFEEV